MKQTYRQLILTLLLLLLTPLVLGQSYDDEDEESEAGLPEAPVIEAVDLMSDGIAAKKEGMVMMVMVSQEYCPFCEDIKRDVVRPMIRGKDFQGELMIRELSIDQGVEIRDFKGTMRSGMNIATDYGADLTPTLLFLGPDGRQLSKKIIGYTTPDLFYYYVEEAIKGALTQLTNHQ